jgi:hypothetical protein
LLGRLGSIPDVQVECLFVDPVADIAVLGIADIQVAPDGTQGYYELVSAITPIPLGSLAFSYRHSPGNPNPDPMPTAESDAYLLALHGHWFACRVSTLGSSLWITEDAAEDIVAGMSGSPIMLSKGRAIGVVCLNPPGPNPFLAAQLPGWLARGLLDIPPHALRKLRSKLAKPQTRRVRKDIA